MADRIFDTITPKEEAAFWSKLNRGSRDECWPWTGATRSNGYGLFYVSRMVVCATHVALILDGRHRPPAPSNFALHECDNPACVNPSHLRWGTQSQNIVDCRLRERRPRESGVRGSHVGTSKLTEEMVKIIRSSPLSGAEIGRRFGVGKSAVSGIRRGHSWKHVEC